jgi:radical SAM-linked protein
MPEAVARWRIVHGRGPSTTSLSQRDEQEAWEVALTGSGLPVALDGRGRPRVATAVPLPVGLEARAERLDVFLVARLRVAEVRAALAPAAPPGHPIVEVHDVWLGAPALPAVVVALDYRVTLAPPPGLGPLGAAAATLLAAPRIERVREKGGRSRSYDLRPLAADLRAIDDATLWLRLRADPVIGGGALGVIAVTGGVRERIWLADESPSSAPAVSADRRHPD